jgi:hypothetical protein
LFRNEHEVRRHHDQLEKLVHARTAEIASRSRILRIETIRVSGNGQ